MTTINQGASSGDNAGGASAPQTGCSSLRDQAPAGLDHSASPPRAEVVPKKCIMLFGFCKRGHPRNKETTFERKTYSNGKTYIVRECRICHAQRNSGLTKFGKRSSTSKWLRYLGGAR